MSQPFFEGETKMEFSEYKHSIEKMKKQVADFRGSL